MREFFERGFTLSLVYLEIAYPARHLRTFVRNCRLQSHMGVHHHYLEKSAVVFFFFFLVWPDPSDSMFFLVRGQSRILSKENWPSLNLDKMERVRAIYPWRFLATVLRLIAAQFQKERKRSKEFGFGSSVFPIHEALFWGLLQIRINRLIINMFFFLLRTYNYSDNINISLYF